MKVKSKITTPSVCSKRLIPTTALVSAISLEPIEIMDGVTEIKPKL